MLKYQVFIIEAYDITKGPQKRATNNFQFQLIDKNVKSAIKRAKKIEKRKHYKLISIIEKFHHGNK